MYKKVDKIKGEILNLAQQGVHSRSGVRVAASTRLKVRGEAKQMNPANHVIFAISISLVILVCCLSRAMIVPMAQGCNNEINTRTYLAKEDKRLFFNSFVEKWFIRPAIAENIEKIRKKQMSGGIEERDKIMVSAVQHEEGATASQVV